MVLVVHHRYRSGSPSGENEVAERELALLGTGPGPAPTAWIDSSDRFAGRPLATLAALAGLSLSPARVRRWRTALEATGERILHAHNLWPSFGLGVVAAARQAGMRTVLTAHNYRLLAANHRLFGPDGARRARDADERERLERMHAAHPSRLADLAYTWAIGGAWRRGLLPGLFDAVVCMTATHRRLLAEGGFPADRLVLKPHFLDHRGPVGSGPGDYALFVGRLDHGKGIDTLLAAWEGTGIPLHVAGSGPLAERLRWPREAVRLGLLDRDGVARAVAGARFLVMNPRWYETFGLVVVEAFAAGTPCLVPAGCCPADLVDPGRTGLLFAPGDLRERARALWQAAPAMRAACRAEYLERYTPARGLADLQRLYANLAAGRPPGEGFSPPPAAPAP